MLAALLDRLRAIYDELKLLNGGVAVLHTEAAIAALESHLRKQQLATDRPIVRTGYFAYANVG